MKYNILHLFSDQFRFDCIGALGNPVIQTPNLDRISKMGVSFTNAYTPSPVCVAARCSMIFGQYPVKTDCFANDTMPQGKTFMDHLTEQGYLTYAIGKCHFTPETEALRGFTARERQEEVQVRSEAEEPYFRSLKESGYNHCVEPHGSRGQMYYIPQISKLPVKHHPTNWIGDRSVRFIQSHTDQPWYLFSSFIHPHPPFAPPVPWNDVYQAVDMPEPYVPQNYEEFITFINKIQNRYKYRDKGIDKNLILTIKAYYYACISFLDLQIGKILKALEESGQIDRTLIVFTADHGEHLGDLNCFGKRTMHDSCAKIPMLVYQKGVFEGGKTCDIPVSLVDLAPTFTRQQNQYDGVALDLLYRGELARDYVFSVYSAYQDCCYAGVTPPTEHAREIMSNLMVKSRDWKYIYSVADQKEFLFRGSDQSVNLANQPKYVQTKQTLIKALMDFLLKNGKTGYITDGQWRKFDYPFHLPQNPRDGLLVQKTSIEWF